MQLDTAHVKATAQLVDCKKKLNVNRVFIVLTESAIRSSFEEY